MRNDGLQSQDWRSEMRQRKYPLSLLSEDETRLGLPPFVTLQAKPTRPLLPLEPRQKRQILNVTMMRQRSNAHTASSSRSSEPPGVLAHDVKSSSHHYPNGKRQNYRNGGGFSSFATSSPSKFLQKLPSKAVLLATLPAVMMVLLILGAKSLLSSISSYNDDYDGPPKNLIVHGKRDFYAPVPPEYRKTAYVGLKTDSHVPRAYRSQGYTTTVSSDEKDMFSHKHHIVFKRKGNEDGLFSNHKPWQRLSRLPWTDVFENKDTFFEAFRKLQNKYEKQQEAKRNAKIKDRKYFIPETYRLSKKADRAAFTATITRDKAIGRKRPWVLKKVDVNNGKGIEMIPPDSPALYSAVDRSMEDEENTYIVQAYICNELTWFGGEKFDLRFYWMVASVDPLIVMYHDGYARVAGALYNETDFESTGQHLTNHAFRGEVDEDVLADAFFRRVQQFYEENETRLSKIIPGGDPVKHVRNQMKEAIGTTAEAFKTSLTYMGDEKEETVAPENLFAFLGCDFIIDADLDVYYVEAQTLPGLGDQYDYRIELFRSLLRPMINIVEEIAMKQEKDAKANLLPIESLGGWELVYAGDWQYEYKGYERSKDKRGCALASNP